MGSEHLLRNADKLPDAYRDLYTPRVLRLLAQLVYYEHTPAVVDEALALLAEQPQAPDWVYILADDRLDWKTAAWKALTAADYEADAVLRGE